MDDNYIFKNVNEAFDYLLVEEQTKIEADPTRATPPLFLKSMPRQKIGGPYDCYFNSVGDDKYVLTPLQSDRYSLKPNLRTHKYLYRGQTSFHNGRCLPGLFRKENKNYFLDDLIYGQELCLLVLSHPLCQLFDLGMRVRGFHIRFEVNVVGLAQHYYNLTNFLDFTSDYEVAKFFAVTDYNKNDDSFRPHLNTNEPGVIYFYDIDIEKDFQLDRIAFCPRLSTIGPQVFPRSEQQKGFLLNMNKGENLNDARLFPQVHHIKFKHDPAISTDVFNKTKCGKVYFPDDILEKHWKQYNKDQKKVSLQAVRLNKIMNGGESISSIRTKLDRLYRIQVRNYQPSFTSDELFNYYNDIKNGWWEQFVNKIYIPGDKNRLIHNDLLSIPSCDEYKWAFQPGINHQVTFKDGFLLKKYESILHL